MNSVNNNTNIRYFFLTLFGLNSIANKNLITSLLYKFYQNITISLRTLLILYSSGYHIM